MVREFKPKNLDEKRLKVNVLLYLIGTLFMTVKSDIGFFTREQWTETCQRINSLLDMVQEPDF